MAGIDQKMYEQVTGRYKGIKNILARAAEITKFYDEIVSGTNKLKIYNPSEDEKQEKTIDKKYNEELKVKKEIILEEKVNERTKEKKEEKTKKNIQENNREKKPEYKTKNALETPAKETCEKIYFTSEEIAKIPGTYTLSSLDVELERFKNENPELVKIELKRMGRVPTRRIKYQNCETLYGYVLKSYCPERAKDLVANAEKYIKDQEKKSLESFLKEIERSKEETYVPFDHLTKLPGLKGSSVIRYILSDWVKKNERNSKTGERIGTHGPKIISYYRITPELVNNIFEDKLVADKVMETFFVHSAFFQQQTPAQSAIQTLRHPELEESLEENPMKNLQTLYDLDPRTAVVAIAKEIWKKSISQVNAELKTREDRPNKDRRKRRKIIELQKLRDTIDELEEELYASNQP